MGSEERTRKCQLCRINDTYPGIPYTICDECAKIITNYMEIRKVGDRLWKQTHDCDLTKLREMLKESQFGGDGEYHLNDLIDSLEDAMKHINRISLSLHNLFVTCKEHLLKAEKEEQRRECPECRDRMAKRGGMAWVCYCGHEEKVSDDE